MNSVTASTSGRDSYIIHLNIALQMGVSLYFCGKAMFQMGKMVQEP